MALVKLPRQAYRDALERTNLGPEDRENILKLVGDGAKTVKVSILVDDLPRAMLGELIHEPDLNANLRAMISMRIHGMKGNAADFQRVYDTVVESPMEFAATFSALGIEAPNCEFFINGRWYPICLGTECTQDEFRMRARVTLNGSFSVGDSSELVRHPIGAELFRDSLGGSKTTTVREVLKALGIRPVTLSTSEYNIKLLNAERLSREAGKCLWIGGSVLISHGYEWWKRLSSRNLGSSDTPRKVIVEPELESGDRSGGYFGHSHSENSSRLPFVRVFSLDTKQYVYADVDDLTEYDFDSQAIERLHLPEDILSILTRVFTAPQEAIFGDLVAGKHGGLVVLASGNPGVGKTLSAEVYSELTGRPLYVMELGELGTSPSDVEENLNRIFARVSQWEAVLQFDECEIFLAKRGNDLQRSAIVGIFLRLLDYYRGILFLTTNRPEVLDYAVLSRVTLNLKYPDLSPASRQKIWTTMLEVASLKGISDQDIESLSQTPLNGREIRNLVRLAKVVYDDDAIDVEKIKGLIVHSPGYQPDSM